MRIALGTCLGLLGCWAAVGQAPPAGSPKTVLEFTGKSLQTPFQCTEENLRSIDRACTEQQPCPVYLELSAIEPVGDRIFVAGNIHSESTTLESVLLASENAGKTWYEPAARIHSASFDQIQFVDFTTGWIGGQVIQAMPRDPFLLKTTDGGKTWRQRPIFSKTRAGTLDRFQFDPKGIGSAWIDRSQAGETGAQYEYYESPNGGESWMLRQASDRPIAAGGSVRPPHANPDWRLHADRASGSYRIEKRTGGNWAVVASFLIRTGECQEAERPLPEPPPEAPAAEATVPKQP
jgi:hypothetical protein